MIYQFKYKNKLKICCGSSAYEDAHDYMRKKYGKNKYKVFKIESTKDEEIKSSIAFRKILKDLNKKNK